MASLHVRSALSQAFPHTLPGEKGLTLEPDTFFPPSSAHFDSCSILRPFQTVYNPEKWVWIICLCNRFLVWFSVKCLLRTISYLWVKITVTWKNVLCRVTLWTLLSALSKQTCLSPGVWIFCVQFHSARLDVHQLCEDICSKNQKCTVYKNGMSFFNSLFTLDVGSSQVGECHDQSDAGGGGTP